MWGWPGPGWVGAAGLTGTLPQGLLQAGRAVWGGWTHLFLFFCFRRRNSPPPGRAEPPQRGLWGVWVWEVLLVCVGAGLPWAPC